MSSLLTVIVPCYNMEKYVGKCLESLVNQTYKEMNILIVDDGSTDDTLRIVNDYAQKYNNIEIIYKENGGISSARNAGIENIKTKYFGFVDSDDYVEKDMFEDMMREITLSDSDVCVCNFRWVWDKKDRVTIEGPYNNSREAITRQYATLWNKIYKTEILNKYNLNFPNGYRYEDAYFLYCMASNNIKYCFVNKVFVNYMQRKGSITHTHNDKVKDMIEVFYRIKNYYDKYHFNEFNDELEFIFAKFFLGNSFLRTCQIMDANERNRVLDMSWDILNVSFPDFRNNIYLKNFSIPKRIYYKIIRKSNYKLIGNVLNFLYRLKGGN